jgi:hypothetical protein
MKDHRTRPANESTEVTTDTATQITADAPTDSAPDTSADAPQGRTARMLSLFAIAALTASAGCSPLQQTISSSNSLAQDECYDENNDGYCDDDGSRAGSYYGYYGGRKIYKRTVSGITNGSGPASSGINNSKPSSATGISNGTSGSNTGITSSDSSSKGGIGSSGSSGG